MTRRSAPASPRRQRGITVLLMVLLIGLAAAITVLAALHALRGGQQRQLTTHAATAAQAAAWRGVETLRLVLADTGAERMQEWAGSPSDDTWTGTCDKDDEVKALDLPIGGSAVIGVPRAQLTAICRTDTQDRYRITAQVTGQAGDGSARTRAMVEVVYEVGTGLPGTDPEPGEPVCASPPLAPLLFNGDLVISGGLLSVTDDRDETADDDYHDIAVAGDITLGGASTARISGCAKGDITFGGGGISDNGHVYAEGTIRIDGMRNPSNTVLWARNVIVGSGVSGGHYAAVQAGAYSVTVHSGSQPIGTAEIGGRLIPSTVSSGLPWTLGTVIPSVSGKTVIALAAGDTYLLDLKTVAIDSDTGMISGASGAELLHGNTKDTLPDVLTFESTAVAGGGISLSTLTIDQLWGHTIAISGWNGNYKTLRSNGNLDIVTGTIGTLVGGSDVTATSAGLYWNFPSIGTGNIAGGLHYGSPKQPVPNPASAIPNLKVNQTGTSPGLPGIPYCDARTPSINVDVYKAQANYVFEIQDGRPHLTIRNVRTADGLSADGTYDLTTTDLRRFPAGNGAPLLTCNSQRPSNGNAHCFRNASATGWVATGVTNFPRGIVWFDGPVTFDGTELINDLDGDGNRDLLVGIFAKGKLTLTQSGHPRLIAPNFSTPALLCGGAFRPTNLCDTTSDTPAFAFWTDTDGQLREGGLPIGNMAIGTEGAAQLSGWNILGNVLIGDELDTAANAVVIEGSLAVGANQDSTTTINSGGARVIVPLNPNHSYLPVCSTSPPTTPAVPATPGTVRVLWSRYL